VVTLNSWLAPPEPLVDEAAKPVHAPELPRTTPRAPRLLGGGEVLGIESALAHPRTGQVHDVPNSRATVCATKPTRRGDAGLRAARRACGCMLIDRFSQPSLLDLLLQRDSPRRRRLALRRRSLLILAWRRYSSFCESSCDQLRLGSHSEKLRASVSVAACSARHDADAATVSSAS
jgi:hypothetical protein